MVKIGSLGCVLYAFYTHMCECNINNGWKWMRFCMRVLFWNCDRKRDGADRHISKTEKGKRSEIHANCPQTTQHIYIYKRWRVEWRSMGCYCLYNKGLPNYVQVLWVWVSCECGMRHVVDDIIVASNSTKTHSFVHCIFIYSLYSFHSIHTQTH